MGSKNYCHLLFTIVAGRYGMWLVSFVMTASATGDIEKPLFHRISRMVSVVINEVVVSYRDGIVSSVAWWCAKD